MDCIVCGKEIVIKKNNHSIRKTKYCSARCNHRAYYLANKKLVNDKAKIWVWGYKKKAIL